MSVNNIRRGTASDLSLGNTVTTTRLPIQQFLPTGNIGDAVYIDRPYFYYNDNWNPMAALTDIPTSPNLYSSGCVYLDGQISVSPNVPLGDFITQFVTQFENNMYANGSGLTVNNTGYYNIKAQAIINNFDTYVGIPFRYWISPYAVTSGKYLTNTGLGRGLHEAEYLVMTCDCIAYLQAGETIRLYYQFIPDTVPLGEPPITMYGGVLDEPNNLGLCTFLQVTWSGEAAV